MLEAHHEKMHMTDQESGQGPFVGCHPHQLTATYTLRRDKVLFCSLSTEYFTTEKIQTSKGKKKQNVATTGSGPLEEGLQIKQAAGPY
jgi:hypothetical protein